MKKKIAIIGASRFQDAVILKAKEMGLETHVFAWKTGDVGESFADYFYPISTRDKDAILAKCREIEVDGVISIGSDLATEAVNYIAEKMGLIGNSSEATKRSRNKYLMRKAFEENGDPSPRSILLDENTDIDELSDLEYPVIVKPTDRSGSRGINKIKSPEELQDALKIAFEEGFEKKALVEEFAEGDEYSVEYISCRGKHYLLAVTQKFTSGEPRYIETGHIQPAPISEKLKEKFRKVSEHALDTLMLTDGASHVELKVDENENIKLIEIGGRMGGGFIGSDLVPLSTGYDYVGNVIRIAMGEEIEEPVIRQIRTVGICFMTKENIEKYRSLLENNPDSIIKEKVGRKFLDIENPADLCDRSGYYIYEISK